jgi:glycosyltransferase involved in cell wall biosynthesis
VDVSGVTVVLDQLVAPVPGGIGRYAINLVRALAERDDRPRPLTGFVPRVDADARERVHALIPGLDGLSSAMLPRPLLARAWERGVAVPRIRRSYSPSLFAPLRADGHHVVTIHDAVPWTHPETLTGHGAEWHRAMGARAARFADIVVTPTEAVAERLLDSLDLGNRIRVIGGAPSEHLTVPVDAAERRARLGVAGDFLAFIGTLEPRKGLERLLESLARIDSTRLVIIGPLGWGGVNVADLVSRSGIDPSRVLALGRLDDADLASVLAVATALVVPSIDEGFGLPVIEAMSLGVPVIHSTAPALLEVAGGHGLAVDVHATRGTIDLAEAITGLNDAALRRDLASRGRARAAQFSWAASAERLSSILDELA